MSESSGVWTYSIWNKYHLINLCSHFFFFNVTMSYFINITTGNNWNVMSKNIHVLLRNHRKCIGQEHLFPGGSITMWYWEMRNCRNCRIFYLIEVTAHSKANIWYNLFLSKKNNYICDTEADDSIQPSFSTII